MASIRERVRKDNTVCYAVLFKIADRQTSVPFDDQTAAELFKQTVEVHGAERACQMYNIDHTPRRHESKQLTVGEWVRHYIDHLTGLEQYSIDVYERYLRNDIAPFLGDIPLADLREEDIANWVKKMQSDPSPRTKRVVAPKTIANKHGFLSGALKSAVDSKKIAANPCAGRKLPRKTGDDEIDDENDIRMLSRDEFDRLLAAGTVSYWRPLIDFMVASGARWGEVSALKPADVDRSAGTVRIRRAWKKSSSGYHIGPTKTKRSKRTINVPPRVLAQLDYSHEWLFTNTAGRPLRYHSFKTNIWNRAVANAKLDPAPTPHDLRHTCASWMLNAGVPITTVSRHLGHESIKITADIYGDVDRATHQAAAEVMDRLLGDR